MSTRHAAPVVVAALLTACGGGTSGSGSPAPTPIPTAIAIAPGTTSLRVGQSETFTASASLSNGQSQSVQAAWQSDNDAVLSIDGTGRALGLAAGAATITAAYQGLVATRLVRVVPSFQGTWQGDYVVRTCDATGDFRTAEFCDREEGFWPGDVLPIQLVLTQGTDQVDGTVSLGQLSGTMTGAIDVSGRLSAAGSMTFTAEGMTIVFALAPMDLLVDGDRMTGRFTATATAAGAAGEGRFEADLGAVVRTASALPPPTLAAPTPPRGFGTLRDAWKSVRRRP